VSLRYTSHGLRNGQWVLDNEDRRALASGSVSPKIGLVLFGSRVRTTSVVVDALLGRETAQVLCTRIVPWLEEQARSSCYLSGSEARRRLRCHTLQNVMVEPWQWVISRLWECLEGGCFAQGVLCGCSMERRCGVCGRVPKVDRRFTQRTFLSR
jgi:hypothetical protein